MLRDFPLRNKTLVVLKQRNLKHCLTLSAGKLFLGPSTAVRYLSDVSVLCAVSKILGVWYSESHSLTHCNSQ